MASARARKAACNVRAGSLRGLRAEEGMAIALLMRGLGGGQELADTVVMK